MSRYPLGQPCRISTTVKDVTGTLVNAGTTVLPASFSAGGGKSNTPIPFIVGVS